MTALIILNPYAGRWKALQRRAEVDEALKAAGVDYELVITSGPGKALELARKAALEGRTPVVAAGGDGTINEVVNGLALAADEQGGNPLCPLGILPLGSADDLVANLRLPNSLTEAAQIIAAGKVKNIDLCKVQWNQDGQNRCRYFDNNSAIGLEPFITLIQQRIQKVRGTPRYLLATLLGVYEKPGWNMDLVWEGGRYSGPISLVTVGNNPRTGGIFYVTPHATPVDGLLTFVYGYLPTRRQILRVLPRLMKPGAGNYVEHPAIKEMNSPWLRVVSQEPTPLHADGEMQSNAVKEIEFQVLPGRLPVLTN